MSDKIPEMSNPFATHEPRTPFQEWSAKYWSTGATDREAYQALREMILKELQNSALEDFEAWATVEAEKIRMKYGRVDPFWFRMPSYKFRPEYWDKIKMGWLQSRVFRKPSTPELE